MSAPRHDYYQTAEHVVLSVYVRHQPKEDVSARVEGQELRVCAPALSDAFTLSLWAPVSPEVDVAVVPSKIELTLRKREGGVMWPTLVADGTRAAAPTPALMPSTAPRPASKWDALDYTDADDAPPSGSGDAELNAFFQKLYADADPDTRRAMVKSFQESGGTALSTNWADVKDKTMSVRAPQGLEARRYEQ